MFVSVKGIYYQAEVQGQPVTWLVPHKFTQHMPSDVDYRIMMTFMQVSPSTHTHTRARAR